VAIDLLLIIMNVAGEFVASEAVIYLALYGALKYKARMPRCRFELLLLTYNMGQYAILHPQA
jgi:hypothetical protein